VGKLKAKGAAMAGYPNRCQHIKVNGTQCGSPALRRSRFCFFHKRFQDEQIKLSTDRARRAPATFVLPVLEDANSIQIALMQVMRLLLSRQIDPKTASLLLYALQTASTNLRMTKFEPYRYSVILDPRDVANTPLQSDAWNENDFEEDDDEIEEEEDEASGAHKKSASAAPAKRPLYAHEIEANIRRKREQEIAERNRKEGPPWWDRTAPRFSSPNQSAAESTSSLAAESEHPSSSPKMPAVSVGPEQEPEQIRAEIVGMVRKELPTLSATLAQSRQPEKQQAEKQKLEKLALEELTIEKKVP
jgi:hypothetical protein